MTARIRRFLKDARRAGQDSGLWPVALLLIAVLVPALSLVWFMNAAMRNEQLAVRQQLQDLYRVQLSSVQARLDQEWTQRLAELEKVARTAPASAAFLKCVETGNVEAVVIFDKQGRVLYPNMPAASPHPRELPLEWREANRLEYVTKDFAAAASAYAALAANATDANVAARALQAQSRCLVHSNQKDAAIRIITEQLGNQRFDQAVDGQGRLIAANGELMALELITDSASPVFQSTAERLRRRLVDYDKPALAASQRRFLMKELQKLWPAVEFPTLAAEELAAQWCEKDDGISDISALQRSALPNLWQFATPDRRVLGLVRAERLVPTDLPELPNAEVALMPSDVDTESALVSLPAGSDFPGWRLTLSLRDPRLFVTAAKHRAAFYLWIAITIVAAVSVLAWFGVRAMRRQVAVARLKNDLAATVSHELKTPLASMRVLVDTLLDSRQLNEQQVHEYLDLIARENERLSRLVQNFLTFSRMDRKKHSFRFSVTSPREIVEAAIKAASDRVSVPGCRLEVQVDPNLPEVMADLDALTTALMNLLDNACKYSEEIKTIAVKARAEKSGVVFSVQDNGIGIPPKELKRIFRDFYQVDQRLSRDRGGCGLGLSIVKFIVEAHGGNVSVESQPGRGSTFSIVIRASAASNVTREATA